jgi:hypothetical protein
MKLKFLNLTIVALLLCSGAFAQVKGDEDYNSSTPKKDKPKKDYNFKDHLVYGGNLGLQLSNRGTFIQLNPMVGYKLTSWMASGIGFNYTYFGNAGNNFSYYGPTVWTRIRPLDFMYLHTEYNYLHASYYNGPIPVWLVGGGIVSRSQFVSFSASLMYDVIQHEASPYRASFVPQVGVLIGF